jgi:hypothetical protein
MRGTSFVIMAAPNTAPATAVIDHSLRNEVQALVQQISNATDETAVENAGTSSMHEALNPKNPGAQTNIAHASTPTAKPFSRKTVANNDASSKTPKTTETSLGPRISPVSLIEIGDIVDCDAKFSFLVVDFGDSQVPCTTFVRIQVDRSGRAHRVCIPFSTGLPWPTQSLHRRLVGLKCA